ncbi:hypothetical protein BH18GEM1_BH18GEM1_17640 [soil metagenome]
MADSVASHRGGWTRRGRDRGRAPRLPFLLVLAVFGALVCGAEPQKLALVARPATPAPVPGVTYSIESLPPESLRLSAAAGSLDDLLRTVEVALAESDTARLFDLRVKEEEYRRILYPAFPASHPPIDADFASLWVTHFPDSYRGLKQVLGRYGGLRVRILDVRFEGPDQDFVNFILHETSRADIEIDGARENDARLFGSVFRVGDGWKVLSYPDDP